uniref:Phage protein n=1 Tax=viral metagenome TaxID=1070528 RepID=A0A6H2A2S1_9ZZZZ
MLKVKLPKQIKIGGFTYKVKLNKLTDAHLKDQMRFGEHIYHIRSLLIDSTLSDEQTSATFIHEVCHAIDSIYCNSRLSEDDIKGMAGGIHQVLEGLGIRFIRGK